MHVGGSMTNVYVLPITFSFLLQVWCLLVTKLGCPTPRNRTSWSRCLCSTITTCQFMTTLLAFTASTAPVRIVECSSVVVPRSAAWTRAPCCRRRGSGTWAILTTCASRLRSARRSASRRYKPNASLWLLLSTLRKGRGSPGCPKIYLKGRVFVGPWSAAISEFLNGSEKCDIPF